MTPEEHRLLTETINPIPKEIIDIYTEIVENDLKETIDALTIEYPKTKWFYKEDSIVITLDKLLLDSGVTEPCGMWVDSITINGRIVRQIDRDEERA